MALKCFNSIGPRLSFVHAQKTRPLYLTFVPDLVDLEGVPKEYQDFADVFSKVKADMLAPH